jgi:HemY protein
MAREKGYRALADGLVSIAAGDGVAADKYARRAQHLVPDTPLTKLLSAQSLMMNGNMPAARRAFADLLEDRNTAFFGLRPLLAESLREGNYRDALDFARQAEKLQPKRVWISRTLFDLETRNRDWPRAALTLKKAEKLGVFDKAQAQRHLQAILTAQAEDAIYKRNTKASIKYAAKAFSLNPAFTPAALRLVKIYQQKDKRRSALKTVKKAWEAQPHPDLADIWMTFKPPAKKARSVYEEGRDIYDWMKELADIHPQHRDSQKALGHAALQARMWREAREYLMRASDFRGLAKLERVETGNDSKAREWLEIAADNPPDPKWVCGSCGNAALDWSALCRRCGIFDRQEWITPQTENHDDASALLSDDAREGGFLSPPPELLSVRK